MPGRTWENYWRSHFLERLAGVWTGDPTALAKVRADGGLPPVPNHNLRPMRAPVMKTGKEPEETMIQKLAPTFDQVLQARDVDAVWAALDERVAVLTDVLAYLVTDPETPDKRAAMTSAITSFGLSVDEVLADWLGTPAAPAEVAKHRPRLEAGIRKAAMGVLRQRARLALETAQAAAVARGVPASAAWSVAVREGGSAYEIYKRLTGIPEPGPPRAPAPRPRSDTAADAIRTQAEALVAKGEVKTVEAGIALVAKRDPALYARHVQEQRARAAAR